VTALNSVILKILVIRCLPIYIYRSMFFSKKRLIIFKLTGILLLNFSPDIHSQTEQKKLYTIRARLTDGKTKKNISFAQVINKSMQWGVVTDTLGVFSFSANIHDTLYISAIGYYPVLIEVADSLIVQVRIPAIPLVEQVYQLDQVNVYSLGTYQQFKYKLLHSTPPDNNIQKVTERIKKEKDMLPKYPLQEQASIPLGHPITALYMLLSKEGKGQRKYEEAKDLHRIFVLANTKFNREMVIRATGLNGNMLEQFMIFCNPDIEFIIQASEYDIYKLILEDYEIFIKEYKRKGSLIKK